MRRRPDSLDRSIPYLFLAGLGFLVLGFMAMFISTAAFDALRLAAVAAWMGAVALLARRWSHTLDARIRLAAIGVPAVIALVLAYSAAGAGVRVAGLAGNTRAGTSLEAVGGAAASPSGDAISSAAGATPSDSAASASPDASPSASPSDTPAPSAPSGPVNITSFDITSPVYRGQTVTANVQTDPGVTCSIHVGYLSTARAQAAGLTPQTASDSGAVTWTWTVSSSARLGRWTAKVTCTNGAYSAWWTRTLHII